MSLVVLAEQEIFVERAKELARCLQFTFIDFQFDSAHWKKSLQHFSDHYGEQAMPEAIVLVGSQGSALLDTRGAFSPLRVDFNHGSWRRRLTHISVKNELLARAVGLKKHSPLSVFDANAGLGQDAFTLAALGASVFACERSPMIHHLLEDGLLRASEDADLKRISDRIVLRCEDSGSLLGSSLGSSLDNSPLCFDINVHDIDVLYLDPMFPDKKGSALVKKEMQIFQSLLSIDEGNNDARALFDSAFSALDRAVCKRLVIKRPRQADFATGRKPDLQFSASSIRFDVYLAM